MTLSNPPTMYLQILPLVETPINVAPKDTFTTGTVKLIEAYHPIPQIQGLKRRFVIAGGGDDVETNGLGGANVSGGVQIDNSSSSGSSSSSKRKREKEERSTTPVKSSKEKVPKSEKKSKKSKK